MKIHAAKKKADSNHYYGIIQFDDGNDSLIRIDRNCVRTTNHYAEKPYDLELSWTPTPLELHLLTDHDFILKTEEAWKEVKKAEDRLELKKQTEEFLKEQGHFKPPMPKFQLGDKVDLIGPYLHSYGYVSGVRLSSDKEWRYQVFIPHNDTLVLGEDDMVFISHTNMDNFLVITSHTNKLEQRSEK